MISLDNLKQFGKSITDLVFPITCIVCGRDGIYICENCYSKLPRLDKQQCLVCQKASPYGKTHPDCVTRNSVDGALSALTHKDKNVREIIRVFKYSFVSQLAEPLSRLIIESINKQGLDGYFQDFVIAPVPLHKRRKNWRGFNQALFLSEALSDSLKIPLAEDLILRTKFTKPQVDLKAEERKRNMENAFVENGEIQNKKILLVDDVITSGSTANELAKLLKSKRASEVWIVSAAHG